MQHDSAKLFDNPPQADCNVLKRSLRLLLPYPAPRGGVKMTNGADRLEAHEGRDNLDKLRTLTAVLN